MNDPRRQAELQAREIVEKARQEAAGILASAREKADAVVTEAEALAESLKAASVALTAEAARLVADVKVAHRELLAELRLPGVAERATPEPGSTPAGRILGEMPRRRGADEVFDLPDWVGGSERE